MSYQPGIFDKVVDLRPATGRVINQRTYTVAASTSIKKGDFVALSTGQVAQAIALPGSDSTLTSAGGVTILGVALADIVTNASGYEEDTMRTEIPVAIADNSLEILLRTYNSTASDSEVGDTSVGTSYRLGRWRGASSSEWWYCAGTATSSTPELKQVDKYPAQATTDDYGLAWYKVVSTQRQAA